MADISSQIRTDDFKKEKHVPVIKCDDQVAGDEMFCVEVTLGAEVAHPNKTEHHIAWLSLYFQPEGAQYPIQVGRVEFLAHGASAEGPDTGPVYTHHCACFSMKTTKPGTLQALAYCNIHGLWQSEKQVGVK